MSDSANLQKCKVILAGGGAGAGGSLGERGSTPGDGIQDDQLSCNRIESILSILLSQTHSFPIHHSRELVQWIHPCLKTILQYWTKGQAAVTNKWSSSCLGLATALGKLLISLDQCSREDYSKYYKLLGFVLAKVTAMGTVSHVHHCTLTSDRVRRLLHS